MKPCRTCGSDNRDASGNCRPCVKVAKVAYQKRHPEKVRAAQAAYQKRHPEKVARNQAAYWRRSLSRRLACNLRARLVHAIQRGAKGGSAVRDLGCSMDELRAHLEKQFQPGMTWENWSPTGWHIDHIRPLASFDLTDPAQCAQACHYTNLQPLWAADNIRKSDEVR